MATAALPVPTRPESGKIPALVLLRHLGARREVIAAARKQPSASLAEFWRTATRGASLLYILARLRERALPEEADRFAALHVRAASAWRATLLASGSQAAAVAALRLAAGPVDFEEAEAVLKRHRTDGPFEAVYGTETAFERLCAPKSAATLARRAA